ncbi:hypothetical protein A7K93_10645 [Candidatus Methylacidiphilum fumarolicum]|uniref:Uncharacterized protein n=2 Tax=Candidatus Methylacidiphilum fumarolicum TaxID=591154 RepID=I0JYH2_METFB|nr:hypothetical protein [Candidatus Methylacidiphilum fumarolicum]MBW6414822.1 hypothetical protein [Candidatus Methylacidiphilum fumarolicum]TFE66510.1 hypothetical protein A7K73_10405 [Candidatus Methylacidiphilum fumarolicum]TFE71572.1 hypothetical protein A7K72_10675 [Candidatus Methylacidiphilum fumarolicum]TFE71577.1 hypothetical protein A7K93_10645 [Candidatus Methylacidiphilum fumarolicum]TFE76676.1 hypothetical protein A7D33_08810 [Candidatus Methylacidiphilum fumarolicum]
MLDLKLNHRNYDLELIAITDATFAFYIGMETRRVASAVLKVIKDACVRFGMLPNDFYLQASVGPVLKPILLSGWCTREPFAVGQINALLTND